MITSVGLLPRLNIVLFLSDIIFLCNLHESIYYYTNVHGYVNILTVNIVYSVTIILYCDKRDHVCFVEVRMQISVTRVYSIWVKSICRFRRLTGLQTIINYQIVIKCIRYGSSFFIFKCTHYSFFKFNFVIWLYTCSTYCDW